LNFSFVHFLEVSERLSSPKLSVQSSSSPLPTSPPPAASSRSSVHIIDENNATLSTSKNIFHKNADDETNNLKRQQTPPSISNDVSRTEITLDENTKKPKPRRRRKKTKQQQQQENEKLILSNDSKHRAQILLEKLTQAIENRSKEFNSNHSHPHSSFLGVEHYKTDQLHSQRSSLSSPDPFTNKLPPKAQRRSSSLNKNFNHNDHTAATDTS
jgi:hypothetical protein